MARPLILALALSAPFVTVACGGSSPQRSTTPRSGSGSASSLLADAPSPLAGDTLRARLPRGTVAPTGPTEAVPGELVRTVHVVIACTGSSASYDRNAPNPTTPQPTKRTVSPALISIALGSKKMSPIRTSMVRSTA